MPGLKRDGVDLTDPSNYQPNPHTFRDTFRNTKPRIIHDEIVEHGLFGQIMFRLVIVLAGMFCVLILLNEWNEAKSQPVKSICEGMQVHIDNNGNIICAERGADLGRGIKSWRYQ